MGIHEDPPPLQKSRDDFRHGPAAVLPVIPAEEGIQILGPDQVRGDGVHSRKSDKSFGNCYS
jgi:hypothetical protein